MDDGNELPQQQHFAVIKSGENFTLPSSNGHVRIERFSLLEDMESEIGKRLVVMANTTSKAVDGRDVNVDIAVSSFIIGKDYDQSCDIILSPSDLCILHTIGPNIPVQVQYTLYSNPQ